MIGVGFLNGGLGLKSPATLKCTRTFGELSEFKAGRRLGYSVGEKNMDGLTYKGALALEITNHLYDKPLYSQFIDPTFFVFVMRCEVGGDGGE